MIPSNWLSLFSVLSNPLKSVVGFGFSTTLQVRSAGSILFPMIDVCKSHLSGFAQSCSMRLRSEGAQIPNLHPPWESKCGHCRCRLYLFIWHDVRQREVSRGVLLYLLVGLIWISEPVLYDADSLNEPGALVFYVYFCMYLDSWLCFRTYCQHCSEFQVVIYLGLWES